MKRFKFWLPTLISVCISQFIAAQQTIGTTLEQQLETMVDVQHADYSTLTEQLEYYQKHPLNLNQASKEQLQSLHLLTDVQIHELHLYLQQNGKLLTVYELQSINGFDMQTINRILPYIKVDTDTLSHRTFAELLKKGSYTSNLRYEQVIGPQKNFNSTASSKDTLRFLDNPQTFVNNFRFNSNNQLYMGASIQKDAGEKLSSSVHGRSDYYSGYLLLRNKGFIKTLAVGDYQIAFGQGLNAWQSIYFIKTVNTINISRSGFTIHPHTSSSRINYLRGVATTMTYKKFELTNFISRITKIKPVALPDTAGVAVQQTNSPVFSQNTYGSHIRFTHTALQLGLTCILNKRSDSVKTKPQLYNKFAFKGTQLLTISTDYNYIYRNFNLFGEVARSDNGGIAYLNGLIVSLDERLAVAVLHRKYQRNYQSLFANAFSENTQPANENGIYIGAQIKINARISAVCYYDQFRFPWLKYHLNSPSEGQEGMIQLNYMASKKLSMYGSLHQKNKRSNALTTSQIAVNVQTNYRYQIDYEISKALKLRNRVELTQLHNTITKGEQGYLIYQDVSYRYNGGKLGINLRYGLFDTDSYAARIYGYENNLPGSYSLPAYYNKGMYTYLMINYKLRSKIAIWLRYSLISYSNKNSNNNGSLEEIAAHAKSEISALLQFKFGEK